MRLIYADEAGTSAKEPVCVVAAVIVDGDRQWRALETDIKRIVHERVPKRIRDGFVVHATEVFSGGRRVKREEWELAERLDFLKELLCLPIVHDVPIAVGIELKNSFTKERGFEEIEVPKSRAIDGNQFAHIMAFNSCMERSDLFLRKYLKGAEVATVVAEDVPEMRKILSTFGLIHREEGGRLKLPSNYLKKENWQIALGIEPDPIDYRIDHIIDVPHFVPKGKAPILQLADVCAFAFRHCLSKKPHGDDLVYAMLGPEIGNAFVNDPVWFEGPGSGLFNTSAYWSDDQRRDSEFKRALLAMKSLSGSS